MKRKNIIMLVLLVVLMISGILLHVYKRPPLLAIHLISAITFTVMAFIHAFSHTNFNRKKFGEPMQTEHIQLDPNLCQACWECVNNCPKQVLGKIDLPIHKHAKIVNPDDCIGCRKCVKSCQYGAITAIERNK